MNCELQEDVIPSASVTSVSSEIADMAKTSCGQMVKFQQQKQQQQQQQSKPQQLQQQQQQQQQQKWIFVIL
jgi:hypothetical protein